jgi:uncharacterized repeat protein (TIGR03803 family)
MKSLLKLCGVLALLCTPFASQSSRAQVFVQTLKTFADGSMPLDAKSPWAALIQGADGALYGTAHDGGNTGAGALFRLNTDGSGYAVLHSFSTDGVDGQNPAGALVQATDGWLYGTTFSGGSRNAGVVFKIQTNGSSYAIIHNFGSDPVDGVGAAAGLVQGSDGNLYGTTVNGGSGDGPGNGQGGTVFRVSPDGSSYAVLHSFIGYTDSGGMWPQAPLLQGSDGTLFGTTQLGGTNHIDGGTLFKLSPDGSMFSLLYAFGASASEGAEPVAGLAQDDEGNLFGTTWSSVFKLTARDSACSVLHRFNCSTCFIRGGVTRARDGALYGVFTGSTYGDADPGSIFRLNPDGTGFATIFSFVSATGTRPRASLLQARDGVFYGITSAGAAGFGTVFRFFSAAAPTILLPPASLTNDYGTSATFVVNAAGMSPLDFRWFRNAQPLTNGGTVSGADTAVLKLAFVTDQDAASYSVVISNAIGSVTSAPAILIVRDVAPVISAQPSNLSCASGTSARFSVVASGSPPLGFQWWRDGLALTNDNGISGADGSSLVLKAARREDSGNYTVSVTNAIGSVTSAPALLTVSDLAPSITSQSASFFAGLGGCALFTVGAYGSLPLHYEWRHNGQTLANGVVRSETNRSTLDLSVVGAGDAGSYVVVVTNTFGSITSAPALLTVLTAQATNSVIVERGWHLIANPLHYPNGDTLNNILRTNVVPGLPDGCQLFKFLNNVTNGSPWVPAVYREAAGAWFPGDLTLSPGEGAFLLNPTSSRFTINFTGVAWPPRSAPDGFSNSVFYLLSNPANEPSTYDQLVGAAPNPGTQCFQWNGFYYNILAFSVPKGADTPHWEPWPPSISIGESAWIKPYAALGSSVPPPPPVYLFMSVAGRTANLHWSPVPSLVTPPSGYTLQLSTNLLNWLDLTNLASPDYSYLSPPPPGLNVNWPVNTNPGAPNLFFRVKQ